MASIKRRFQLHRQNSKQRGIPFLLTFEEWLKIWTASGYLHKSGKCKGQYCMARRGDLGAYKIGSVRIITVEQNHEEMRHTPANKEKARLRWLGRKHSAATKAKVSRTATGNQYARKNFSKLENHT